MKKIFLLTFAAFAFAFVSCSKVPQAVITAELTNTEDQKVYLNEMIDGETVALDTVDMIGGKFTITTTEIYPRQLFLSFEKNARLRLPFVVEEGNITVKGDYQTPRDVIFAGTPTNDATNALNDEIKPLYTKMGEIETQFAGLDKNMAKEQLDSIVADLRTKYGVIAEEVNAKKEAFIESKKGTILSALMISQSRPGTYEEVEAALARITPETPKNKFSDDLLKLKDKLAAIRIGEMAPDFTVKTPAGDDISLSSLKGQVVLLDFWASWCGPCRSANPSVVALYNKYNTQGFTVFGVSLDKDKENWIKAIEDDKLTWYHGSDLKYWSAAPAALYAVSGIPQTFLIDKEGRIAGNNLHGEELEAKVAELVGAQTPAAN